MGKKLVSGLYECNYTKRQEEKETFYTERDRLCFPYYTDCIIIISNREIHVQFVGL